MRDASTALLNVALMAHPVVFEVAWFTKLAAGLVMVLILTAFDGWIHTLVTRHGAVIHLNQNLSFNASLAVAGLPVGVNSALGTAVPLTNLIITHSTSLIGVVEAVVVLASVASSCCKQSLSTMCLPLSAVRPCTLVSPKVPNTRSAGCRLIIVIYSTSEAAICKT